MALLYLVAPLGFLVSLGVGLAVAAQAARRGRSTAATLLRAWAAMLLSLALLFAVELYRTRYGRVGEGLEATSLAAYFRAHPW